VRFLFKINQIKGGNLMKKATKIANMIAVAVLVLATEVKTQIPIDTMMKTYNVITFGNALIRSEIEGRTWIGGTATVPNSTQFGFNTLISQTDYALVVGNGITGNGPFQINQGSVLSKFATSATWNMNSGGTVQIGTTPYSVFESSVGWTINSIRSNFQTLSNQLDGLAADSVANLSDFNNGKLTGSGSMVSIIDVNVSSLTALNGLTLNANGSSLVIVNVHGTPANPFNGNFMGSSSANRQKFLWNFVNATSITMNRQWQGTVLAPYALVVAKNGFEGGMFSSGLEMYDEGHFFPLNSVIPEPSTFLLFVTGAALTIFRLRRRRR